jgi:hypothetical protein
VESSSLTPSSAPGCGDSQVGPVSDGSHAESAFVRDFRGMKEIRFLGEGSYGTVMLVEDESTHEQIAVKTFPEDDQDTCRLFFREIEFLIRLGHPCVIRIVGYFLATRGSGAQIGT